jgi:hypothetical protein
VPESSATATLISSSLSSDSHYSDTVARMVAEVADALGYAHKEGVIHRDIKPSNLLLSPAGRLNINDFGLARMMEQPGMTVSGEFVGTPRYMSPEQIAAGRIPLDHRTDIYSLGAALYELLTLEPPHQGESREQMLAQIVQKEPKAPRSLQKKVPVDLETICLKCLEKDPDRRYHTAGELAEDLRRYVNRFAIAARRAGPVRRLVKWARRQPVVATSLACLLIGACVTLTSAYRAHVAEQLRATEQEQARLQLLDEKVRNACQVASAGDLRRTDEAIKEVEALGASTGEVRLLRGMAAYFRSDTEAAVSELEQAVKLLPESVAARALLAMAYTDYGQYERYEQLILEIESLSPSSPEDYLFKGYARQGNEAGQGLSDLNEGIRRGDSPLGRALRAFVRTNRAIDSVSRQDVEGALADANAARGMLPDNPFVLYVSLYARVAAAGIYKEAKQTEQRRAVLEEAARDAQALGSSVELPNSAFAMWLYFEEVGDPGRALDVAHRSVERSRSPQAALYCAISLYRQARFIDALRCLDSRRQNDLQGDLTRAFIVAELPGEPYHAIDDYNKVARNYLQNNYEPKFRADILLLLGKKQQALAIMQRFRPPFAISRDWREFYEAERQFGCGELPEDAYLAEAGTSRWRQAFAHRQIGLFRLAEGDRTNARYHFQKSFDTHAIWYYEWAWSQMYLSRMRKDPVWPPWIPVKQ